MIPRSIHAMAATLGLLLGCSSPAPPSLARVPTTPRPDAVPAIPDELLPERISVGDFGGCALTRGHDIACWGSAPTDDMPILEAKVRELPNLRVIAAGDLHACAIDESATLHCWGDHTEGALGLPADLDGDGEPDDEYLERVVQPLNEHRFVDVDVVMSMTCAVTDKGRVVCMGTMPLALEPLSEPRFVPGIEDAVAISLGEEHGCAITRSGGVACWGENIYGEVGPAAVDDAGYDDEDFADEGGDDDDDDDDDDESSYDDDDDGDDDDPPYWHDESEDEDENGPWHEQGYDELVSDRSDDYFDRLVVHSIDGFDDVVEIAVASDFSCARDNAGQVWCWGSKRFGVSDYSSDVLAAPERIPGIDKAISLSAGTAHACAVLEPGDVVCWGSNDMGELGDGTTRSRVRPAPATIAEDAVQIAASSQNTCALGKDSRVRCWGNNRLGAFGFKSTEPPVISVPGISATHVFALRNATCATLQAGDTQCWGNRLELFSKDGPLENSRPRSLTEIPATGARAMIEAWNGICVLDEKRTMRCWSPHRRSEESKPALELPGVVEMESSYNLTCARLVDESVSCWSRNPWRLGGRTLVIQSGATPIPGVRGVRDIAVAEKYACAALESGALWCWGEYTRSASGNGSDPRVPTRIPGIEDAIEVAANSQAICIRTPASRVRCWSVEDSGPPGMDMGLDGMAQLLATNQSICARSHAGRAWCWTARSLKTASASDLDKLVQPVERARDLVAASAGGDHICARRESGRVLCWGGNRYGQLGNVPRSIQLEPVQTYPRPPQPAAPDPG